MRAQPPTCPLPIYNCPLRTHAWPPAAVLWDTRVCLSGLFLGTRPALAHCLSPVCPAVRHPLQVMLPAAAAASCGRGGGRGRVQGRGGRRTQEAGRGRAQEKVKRSGWHWRCTPHALDRLIAGLNFATVEVVLIGGGQLITMHLQWVGRLEPACQLAAEPAVSTYQAGVCARQLPRTPAGHCSGTTAV